MKGQVKLLLLSCPGLIHLSFDLWTSPNCLALLGMVAHFFDGVDSVLTLPLGIPQLRGPHSGANIAQSASELIEWYEIGPKIGYFVLDNASSNDKAVDVLIKDLLDHEGYHATHLHTDSFRLRCMGHVVNLVAHAFLNGIDFGNATVLQSVTAWRKKGPLGKLHAMVRHIRMTPQRRHRYRSIQVQDAGEDSVVSMVIQDNDTRWNSIYMSIQSALRSQSRCQLYQMDMARAIYQGMEEGIVSDDVLTADDWDDLRGISEILKPFSAVTLRLEGHAANGTHGSLWEVLPCIEYLFEHLHKVKAELEALSHRESMLHATDLAIKKLEQYYAKTDENVAIIAALVMNPTIKWTYLMRKWTGEAEILWLRRAQGKVQCLWDIYKNRDISTNIPDTTNVSTATDDSIDSFLRPPQTPHESEPIDDEYDRYCRSPVASTNDLIKWWVNHKLEYPRLSQMAFDLLSIPATETECERLFSGCGNLITDRRNSLSVESVESTELLKVWCKRGMTEKYFKEDI